MRSSGSIKFWMVIALAPFAVMLIMVASLSAGTPIFENHVETLVVVTTQQWMHGRPLYHDFNSPYFYSVVYGPLEFIWLAGALTLCPDPIMAGKLSGGLWALSTYILCLFVFRRLGGWRVAIAGLGIVGAELLPVWLVPFWNRSDPILIFCVALGLAVLVIRHVKVGGALLVLALAIAIGCKIHGFLYLLPVAIVWWQRHGVLGSLAIVIPVIGLCLLPFLLPGISLKEYLLWLELGSHHPFKEAILITNIETLVPMFLPLILFAGQLNKTWRDMRQETLLLAGVFVAGLLVCIPAAKAGSGPYHLVPFVIYIGYLFCFGLVHLRSNPRLNWATCIFAGWIFLSCYKVAGTARYVWRCRQGDDLLVQTDLRQLLTKYPAAQTQMGVGGDATFIHTLYSPWIYREGAPCVLQPTAYMDMQLVDIPPTPLTRSFAAKEFRYWLIPHNDRPFTLNSYYRRKLFDDSIGRHFLESYEKVDHSVYFDVYRAK